MTALYLFGVVRAGMARSVEGLAGLAGEPLGPGLVHGPLAAIAAPVTAADFTGPAAEARLGDLTWVAPRAVRHQEVLGTLLGSGPVLPARFGTLFSGEEALRAFLERGAGPIGTFLDEVDGCREWGVKGLLETERATEALVARAAAALPQPELSPGRRYLEERRLRADARRQLDAWLGAAAPPLAAALAPLARATRSRPVPRGGGGTPGEEAVFSWALLVEAASEPALLAEVGERGGALAADGLRLELSGPWPPYSFCPDLSF